MCEQNVPGCCTHGWLVKLAPTSDVLRRSLFKASRARVSGAQWRGPSCSRKADPEPHDRTVLAEAVRQTKQAVAPEKSRQKTRLPNRSQNIRRKRDKAKDSFISRATCDAPVGKTPPGKAATDLWQDSSLGTAPPSVGPDRRKMSPPLFRIPKKSAVVCSRTGAFEGFARGVSHCEGPLWEYSHDCEQAWPPPPGGRQNDSADLPELARMRSQTCLATKEALKMKWK